MANEFIATRRKTLIGAATVAAASALGSELVTKTAQAQRPASTAGANQSISAEETQAIAQEAYIYLYPLILMDLTRKQFTNLDPKISPFGGPGQCVHPSPRISTSRSADGGASEFRYALFERVARPDQWPGRRLNGGYRRPLFHAAHARHVDRCFCRTGQADQRHRRGELRSRAAGMEGKAPARR